jgi:hypothetical protein
MAREWCSVCVVLAGWGSFPPVFWWMPLWVARLFPCLFQWRGILLWVWNARFLCWWLCPCALPALPASVRGWIWCFIFSRDHWSTRLEYTLVTVMMGGSLPLKPDRVSSDRWLPPLELWWTGFESLDLGSNVWCNDFWVFYSLEVGLELWGPSFGRAVWIYRSTLWGPFLGVQFWPIFLLLVLLSYCCIHFLLFYPFLGSASCTCVCNLVLFDE